MSRYKTAGLIIAAGAGVAIFAPKFFNPARTTAVQAIEARYTAGGATPDGEKARATRRGDSESVYTPAETRDQVRLREQKEDLAGMNSSRLKGDAKVVNRAPPEDRPRSS